MDVSRLLKFKKLYNSLPSFLRKPANDIMYEIDIKKVLKQFLTEEEYNNTSFRREITKDIRHCRKVYQTKAVEYFLFGFRGLTHEQRIAFLPDMVKDSVLNRVVGLDVMNREMKDKYNFYRMLGQYFKRDAMLIPKEGGNLQEFIHFANMHKELFIKANLLSKGRNACLYHVHSDEEAIALYEELVKAGIDWIVEEKIIQRQEMAQWNESSVNTIRLPAFLNNNKWTVLSPVLRTGRKGAVVDNAGAGGIVAVINSETGVLVSDGVDERCNYYEHHPDSGIRYKGWQVPQWMELLKLAEEIQRIIPQHKYVGWDFALTEKGWSLIEGNWGQFLSQYNDHIGLKDQFLELLGIDEKEINE